MNWRSVLGGGWPAVVGLLVALAACLAWGVAAFAIAALGHIEDPATTGEVVGGAVTAVAGIVSIGLAV